MTKRDPLRVVALIGHHSRFGRAVLEGLSASEASVLVATVLGSDERWEKFRAALKGPESTIPATTSLQRLAARLKYADPRWGLSHTLEAAQQRALAKVKRFLPAGLAPAAAPPAASTAAVPPAPDHRTFHVTNANDPAFIEQIRALKPDVIVVGAYPQILSKAWTELAKICAVNVHPSALPRFRGAHPVWWALALEEDVTGVSVHRLTSTIDDGDVLYQTTRPTREVNTYAALYDWAYQAGVDATREALRQLRDGVATWTPQDERLASAFREPRLIHQKIQWEVDSAAAIERKVRATGTYFVLDGHPFVVGAAAILNARLYLTNDVRPVPGSVLSWSAEGIDVATHDGGVVRLSDLTIFSWKAAPERLVTAVGARLH